MVGVASLAFYGRRFFQQSVDRSRYPRALLLREGRRLTFRLSNVGRQVRHKFPE